MRLAYLAIDPQALLAASAGDVELFRSLSAIFLESAPAAFERMQLAVLRDAVQHAGQAAAFIAASHSLRGMTALVGARGLTAQLGELEQQARHQGCPGAGELAPVRKLFALVCEEVQRSLDSPPDASA